MQWLISVDARRLPEMELDPQRHLESRCQTELLPQTVDFLIRKMMVKLVWKTWDHDTAMIGLCVAFQPTDESPQCGSCPP